MYKGQHAIPVCAHCKGLNYPQYAHKCKYINSNPGLVPRDLTLDDELLAKDPYKLYWKNWEAAVNYQEKLVKRYEPTDSEKKLAEEEEEQAGEEISETSSKEQDNLIQEDFDSKDSQDNKSRKEIIERELKEKVYHTPDGYCNRCLGTMDKVHELEKEKETLERKANCFEEVYYKAEKKCENLMQRAQNLHVKIIDNQQKQDHMNNLMGQYVEEINQLKQENKFYKDKHTVMLSRDYRQVQHMLFGGGLQEQMRTIFAE